MSHTYNNKSRCSIDNVDYANNYLSLERKLHFIGVKHAVSHLYDSPIILFWSLAIECKDCFSTKILPKVREMIGKPC